MTGIYGTPRVPSGSVPRTRLDDILTTDAPLTVVRAPAGSGKTVAVTQWANRQGAGVRGVWITVDAVTGSRFAFWRGVLQRMGDAGLLRPAPVLRKMLKELDAGDDIRSLLLRGFAQLTHTMVLIIDNLHLVSEADVREDLIALLTATPALQVVAITRLRSTPGFDSAAVTLGSVVVEAEPLLFSVEETADLLSTLKVEGLDETFPAYLHRATGGMPLTTRGVIFLLQRDGFDLDAESVQERLEVAGAQVMRDMWTLQVGEDRNIDFIIRCSVPEKLTSELATRLTGRDDAVAILRTAESLGVGMWGEGATGPEFIFTPALRTELQQQLRQRFPDEIEELNRTAARWYLEQRQYFAALRHAIAGEDPDTLGLAIINSYGRMLSDHRAELVELLGSLPLSFLRRNPLPTMLLAMALNMLKMHRVRALEMFTLAVVSSRLIGNRVDPIQRAVLLTIETGALRVIGQVGPALTVAQRAVDHYEALTVTQKDELRAFVPTLYTHSGLSFFTAGESKHAVRCFQAAYAFPREIAEARNLHALALTAGVHAINGDMPEVRLLVEVARQERWPAGRRDGYLGAMYQLAEGYLALEAGDYDEALARVGVLAPHLETIEHWPELMQLQALALLGAGKALEAATTLSEAMRRGARPSVTPRTRAQLDATRAVLLLAAGQHRGAENALKGHPKQQPDVALATARIRLAQANPQSARHALQPLAGVALSPRQSAEVELLQAVCALNLGEHKLALGSLKRAMAWLDDRGLRIPLLLLPEDGRQALAEAAERANLDYALLNAHNGMPTSLIPRPTGVKLTERESVVLKALVNTASVAEISEQLFVTVNTVKSQLRSLYRKLGAKSREEALARAADLGLLYVVGSQ